MEYLSPSSRRSATENLISSDLFRPILSSELIEKFKKI